MLDFASVDDKVGYRAYSKEFDQVVDAGKTLAAYDPLTIERAESRLRSSIGWHKDEASEDVRSKLEATSGAEGISLEDTLVTLLVSTSGSARNDILANIAPAVAIVARALENAGCAVEILGHTTNTWNGGRTGDRWYDARKPKDPGRICDLLHVVYKSADQTCDEAENNLALMMMEGYPKENVDGEALQWACERAEKAGRSSSVIVHVMDKVGPIDQHTDKANPPGFLEAHRDAVVEAIRSSEDIVLTAAGLGSDTPRSGGNYDLAAGLAIYPGSSWTTECDVDAFVSSLATSVSNGLALRHAPEGPAAPGL
jgi:cobalamin biosynthesis protein CobT